MDSKREGSKSVLLAIVSSGPSKITAKKYLLKDYNKSHPHSDISQIYTANLVLPPNHHLQDPVLARKLLQSDPKTVSSPSSGVPCPGEQNHPSLHRFRLDPDSHPGVFPLPELAVRKH